MKIKVIDCVSDQGNANVPNEDACGATELSAWVLDGATGLGDRPLLPGDSDAAWLVSAYDARFRANASRTDTIEHLLTELISEVRAEFEARKLRTPTNKFEVPSAGLAFVRLQAANLEYARIGDCRAIISRSTHAFSTGSSPLQFMDAAIIERMKSLRRSGAFANYEQIRGAVQGDLRANRNFLNTEDGYWVLSTDPGAASHIEVGTVPLGGVGSILVYTIQSARKSSRIPTPF